MEILIITPASPGSLHGNRTTADRWAKILSRLGHHVQIEQTYTRQNPDILIALHAWRSANSIQQFTQDHPHRPLILALTGTDINHYINTDTEIVNRSLDCANFLITLNEVSKMQLSSAHQSKCITIVQSSEVARKREFPRKHFNISVSGHLRAEKDPLRTAIAVRSLPSFSKIHVLHFGHAHTPAWAHRARFETARNRRYQWLGGLKQQQWFSQLQRSQLMVLSSLQEGGANVISEALTAQRPILASYIPGNIGLLGENYPGYFDAGDTLALRNLLLKSENDAKFFSTLTLACLKRQPLFSASHEQACWRRLLAQIN